MTMPEHSDILERIRAVSAASPFNAWAAFDVRSAANGEAEIALTMRPEFRQHAGFLHAGMMGALIDTACGFAAATVAGNVLASQYQVALYAPGAGDRFVVRARVVKAGKRQIFAAAEVFDLTTGAERLIAGGTAVLMTVA